MEALHIAPEVREALAAGRGVVALETSAVAHGLPPPRGLEAARKAQAAVRGTGCVPAAVAVTPFLLAEVARLLGPEVVEANVALLEENARVAGEVAAEMARRR